jgi:hypothetical protein
LTAPVFFSANWWWETTHYSIAGCFAILEKLAGQSS